MPVRRRNMEKTYDPKPIENKWYQEWLSKGKFHADADSEKPSFSIVIPPPNVTGSLHVGHAFNNTFQDIMCRFKRMQGYNVLWLPGTDHAGIATQNVVERQLAKEGLSRRDMGRQDFVERVWEWKKQYGETISSQQKKLGNSCDWDRERFTLDEGLSRAVRTVFVRLYKKDLIYKGKYIINWCSRCHTALSDIEVEHENEKGMFYHVRYPFVDEEGEVIIATTRPETIYGDVAIAVHPRDEKNRHLIGKRVRVPLGGRVIPIIEDNMVDPEFGTGCVKITPAHDPNDFLVGQRHDLEQLQVIDGEGIMNENAPELQGMPVAEARKKSVLLLKQSNSIVREEEIDHSVGHCYRCKTTVEPYLSEQWFVRTKPLADAGIEAVRRGDIRFVPEQWEKTYFQWMENIRDWCISRQLWWGHRIPAWTCDDCGHVTVSETDPSVCEECGSARIRQDEDVLDTWFSSALWPFSTLGWPDHTKELDVFYPTSLMVTGFDIIFFWVARMIMMGIEFMGKEPFKDVYIHALIRDEEGQKMSKSKGNVIDPLDMIERYGADALRLTFASLTVQGRDILLSPAKIETYRFFMNKLWNASRFALANLDDEERSWNDHTNALRMHDLWILRRTSEVVLETEKLLEGYFIGESARLLYDFVWGEVCDWYVELAKPALHGEEGEDRRNATMAVLEFVFRNVLLALHPFIPFVTEELWQQFAFTGDLMEDNKWPSETVPSEIGEKAKESMTTFQEVVRVVRNLRAEARIAPQQKIHTVFIQNSNADVRKTISENGDLINLLVKAETISFIEVSAPKPAGCLASSFSDGQVFVFVGDLLDIPKEIARLREECAGVEKDIITSTAKLNNEKFVSRAPKEVVEQERARLEESEAKAGRIRENIVSLEQK